MTDSTPYAVILAGGSGTRFWPKSRQKRPKQLCTLGPASKTMIEQTVQRLDGFIPPSHRIVVTHKDQLAATQDILKDSVGHYLSEPVAKNTAPALIYASLYIQKLDPNARMVSLHADHLIQNPKDFVEKIQHALAQTDRVKIALIGISPSYPETGYGYIQKGSDAQGKNVFPVLSFKEKPDRSTAESYLASGEYLWNAGYFCWKISEFLGESKEYLPQLTKELSEAFQSGTIEETYPRLESIAVDNGILERSSSLCVLPLHSGWSDVGSWDALGRDFGSQDQSYIQADCYIQDCSSLTIDSSDDSHHFIAALGLKDMIIVHTKDATLVCHKDQAQNVKDIVSWLKTNKKSELT